MWLPTGINQYHLMSMEGQMTATVHPFPTATTIETDEGLIDLMKRSVVEVFDGDEREFEEAYAQALAQQIADLSEANNGFTIDLAEELADAMRGVLLQWLGEHQCCPREELFDYLKGYL